MKQLNRAAFSLLFINLFADYRRPPETLDGLPPEVRLAGAPADGRLTFGVAEERVVGVDIEELRVGVVVRLAEPGKLVTVELEVRVEGVTELRVLLFPFGRLKVETADVRPLLKLGLMFPMQPL